MSFKEKINAEKLPVHIAIIMDGNGRWAKTHGKPRIFGHKNGVKSVRETTEAAAELGIQYLTLYAFSTENWNRPKYEVSALMSLLVDTIGNELNTLNKNDIRLNAIGDLDQLPSKTAKALAEAIENTKNNRRMTLTLALNYSGRWEIARAAKLMAEDYKAGKISHESLNQDTLKQYLNTSDLPDPELLIRTSGELRVSNYLLWQIAYAELYFTEKFWPEFRKEDLYEAIYDFQHRERRFGKTSEQII